jgi:hypothetical protein
MAVQCLCNSAHARTHTHAITLSETRYFNLLLITLHMPYNEAFPEVFHFNCVLVESNLHPKHSTTLTRVRTNFPRIQLPPQNSGRKKVDMKQVAYRGTKYIRRQRSQFSWQDSCTSALSSLCSHNTWGIQHVVSPEIIKEKFTLEQATRAQRGRKGTALLFC